VALEKYVDTRFDAIDKEVKSAKESMEHRLAGMNEFREALREQTGKYVTRGELLATVIGISGLLIGIVGAFFAFMR
jgi:hypothetical protein